MDSNGSRDVFGMATLVNPARTIPQVAAVEQSFINIADATVSAAPAQISPTDEFNRRIADLESSLGVTLGVSRGSELARASSDTDFDDADESHSVAPQIAQHSVEPQLHLSADGMRYTEEAVKADRMSSALSALSISPDDYLAVDRENDEKLYMIEEIEDLVSLFRDDGDDVKHIRIPSVNDPISEISSLLKILRRRNDRKRYGSIADDCFMLAATSVAHIFNGEREFFGFQPDLRGWPDHMRAKLRRMRHDTARVTSSLMNGYNFGVVGRVALETIPSMFMYARDHANPIHGANDTPVRRTNADFANAVDRLSDS